MQDDQVFPHTDGTHPGRTHSDRPGSGEGRRKSQTCRIRAMPGYLVKVLDRTAVVPFVYVTRAAMR